MKTVEIIINKSRFIGFLTRLTCENDIKNTLDNISKEHKKATHICYAYVYNVDKVLEKFSDDGEPKGTAGAPIMNVLKKRKCQNTLIAVVRYFGGIKLGAGGLIRAYSKTAGSLFEN